MTLIASTSIAQAQNGPSAKELRLSDGAFACEDLKIAELKAMSRDQLEGTYCSYVVSAKLSLKQDAEAKAKYANDARILSPILEFSGHLRNRCVRGAQKSLQLFSRKFVSSAPDCKLMWDRVKAAADENKGGLY